MANAFFILGIVMAAFAILAVDFFADRDDYNFGSFSRAYFTMFQVRLCTMSLWYIAQKSAWQGTSLRAVCALSYAHKFDQLTTGQIQLVDIVFITSLRAVGAPARSSS